MKTVLKIVASVSLVLVGSYLLFLICSDLSIMFKGWIMEISLEEIKETNNEIIESYVGYLTPELLEIFKNEFDYVPRT